MKQIKGSGSGPDVIQHHAPTLSITKNEKKARKNGTVSLSLWNNSLAFVLLYVGEENMDASEESERKGKTEIERGVGAIGF